MFSGCVNDEGTKSNTKTNAKWGDAPDFQLTTIDGKDMRLSDLKGDVIILNFWATWCPPCREEIPDFIELYDEYHRKGLSIIGVSVDRGESEVREFYTNNNMNYPVLMANDKVVADYGGIRGIPTTFIIDTNGDIVEKLVGLRSKDVFEKYIKKMLP